MKTLEIGKTSDKLVNQYETDREEILKDYREIRKIAEKMDLFKTNPFFFLMHFIHILMFDALGSTYSIMVWGLKGFG